MAKIKKTITGLKPDSNYLFTLKPKNVEISAIDEAPEAIRIKTPSAVGNPSNITGLTLAANFETVMFAFNPVNDIDLDYFEYRLYNNSAGTGTLINEKTATNGDSISGTAKANVFTVSVPNSTSSSNTAYWGTVRTVSTAGTRGAWVAPLVGSGNTPLIQDQYINSLTAAKISSGTISAAEIVLSGAISKIQSSSYNPSDPVGTRQGWIIRGDGTAEFSAASIRGTLTAAAININANNYWTTNDSGATFQFKVGNATNYFLWNGTNIVVNGSTITGGSVGGISASTDRIYIRSGGGVGSYNDPNTQFYVDNTGKMSLKQALVWDGTNLTIAGNVSISGNVTIGGAAASTVVSGAATGANSLQPGGAASDVNNNTTTISGNKIRTGSIDSNNFSWNGSTTYSTAGTRLDLVNGEFIGKNFRIDSLGNASFTGSGSFSGTITAGAGSIGGWTIGSSTLSGGGVTLNSTGIISTQYTSGGQTNYISINNPDNAWNITLTSTQSTSRTKLGYSGVAVDKTDGTDFSLLGSNSLYISAVNASVTVNASGASRPMTLQRAYSVTGDFLQFYNNSFNSNAGTVAGRVEFSSQNTVAYQTSSDSRLKTNITEMQDTVSIIKKIKPVKYNFIHDSDKKVMHGFIAQELYEVYPQPVSVGGEDPTKNPWSIAYGDLTPLLTAAIKELCDRIEYLESKLNN